MPASTEPVARLLRKYAARYPKGFVAASLLPIALLFWSLGANPTIGKCVNDTCQNIGGGVGYGTKHATHAQKPPPVRIGGSRFSESGPTTGNTTDLTNLGPVQIAGDSDHTVDQHPYPMLPVSFTRSGDSLTSCTDSGPTALDCPMHGESPFNHRQITDTSDSGSVSQGENADADNQFSEMATGGAGAPPGPAIQPPLPPIDNVVSHVPEPATWVMMLLGFLAAGYARRSRPARSIRA